MAIKKTTTITGEIAVAIRSVKIDETATAASEFKRTFDFTGCTREQLFGPAVRSLVIDEQGDYRKATPTERKKLLTRTIKVTDMLSKKRKPRVKKPPTPTDVANVLAQMTPEQRDIAMAAYNAK